MKAGKIAFGADSSVVLIFAKSTASPACSRCPVKFPAIPKVAISCKLNSIASNIFCLVRYFNMEKLFFEKFYKNKIRNVDFLRFAKKEYPLS